ncbi:hypothetical protein MO973_42125 [Paenibacillus sp. TRM 82003]|uniref:hypothetical protein n=1 Tax=Kineococcus sp. TRM81007 TaxID=2925831 RepID=UPI001F5666B5|nr:hypothetical protein [Kineococcus sp. TRM81007]MCI2239646.1 hypothetical protein [Kineococcus sp. TRM81007]MCI3926790.1 hypothetical protein [Paenibacillus sp. TRM 82003]
MRPTHWTWTFEDADGRPVEGGDDIPAAQVFATQADAEAWIGENWRALRGRGAETAHLTADGRRVGGPLGLHPAD